MAVTIIITKDPGIRGGFLDSAAALTVSIEEANSIHDITLIALIHKDVKKCVPVLKALGYEIRAYDVCLFSFYFVFFISLSKGHAPSLRKNKNMDDCSLATRLHITHTHTHIYTLYIHIYSFHLKRRR